MTPEAPRGRFAFLLVLLLVLGAVSFILRRQPPDAPLGNPQASALVRQVAAIETREERVVQAVWPKELLAEKCGAFFENLWDRVNAASNKLEALASLPTLEIVGPALADPQSLACGIRFFLQTGPGTTRTATDWNQFLADARGQGWQLERIELRHLQFDADAQGRPGQSRYYASAHLTSTHQRAILEGELAVSWQGGARPQDPILPRRIEARNFTLRTRESTPALREVMREEFAPLQGSFFIDPLIVYDLDADGYSEIILPACNVLLRRGADGQFVREPFCRHPPGLIFTGILADFDGDGRTDFLCARFEGMVLFKGSAGGRFDEPGRLVWAANPHLRYAQALTCGDIDGDGDLDVWLGQYKAPYARGQMPTPYYDANDGNPSYLLLNDGAGNLTDATVQAGLAEHRWRRVYSGSFADLNDDGRLDLAVASDFAGLALYENSGQGRFTDVTSRLPEWHAFGMAQICADLDGDGLEDILMIGMNVPVADRLQHFGRARAGYESYLSMMGAMTYGNRLFLQDPAGAFRQSALNHSIARSGWSWGCGAFDLDNDGYLDLYVANGHESKQSVRDYETEFWLHDIYVGNSKDDLAAFAYFRAKEERTRGKGMSYGGHERNRLYLNQRAGSFVEIAHLMGVGLEEDSRNVVADDLDRDGRMDLLVTTFEVWPKVRQTLRIFMNTVETGAHWIGFHLRADGTGVSPVGARVELRFDDRTAVRQLIAGDSYRSQQPNTAHFGLGMADRVESATIRWPNGRKVILREPAIDQYHPVRPP